ncbi:TolC family protein [Acidipila sp. EB88]|nr:TolC family protein [Acidipila sp. EB88]
MALRKQPMLQAAQFRARAQRERIREQSAARLPTIVMNATGSLVADTGTSTAAGALTTSSLSDRFAYGGTLVQLVTDFGRTSSLISSERSETQAANDRTILTQAAIRLSVRDAYFQVLGAEAVLHAAEEARRNRALIYHQVSELAASQLRSTLDVNFAGVLESQAELAVVQARSLVEQQRARLGTAMGNQQAVTAPLVAEALPSDLPATVTMLLAEADTQRADLQAARAEQMAAKEFSKAQTRLNYPTLDALGSAGQIPFHDHTLQGNYAAAGFNLRVPIFNGGLFHAQQAEAALNASARERDTREQQLEVSQQVQTTWIAAQEAFQSIAVTRRLVEQSREAFRLAKARYDAGLGSIVELNEAQLNQTSAEISVADATFTYLSRRALLDYATGQLN